MHSVPLVLTVLPDEFALFNLPVDAPLPDWLLTHQAASLYSITRTTEELSIVCPSVWVPGTAVVERGWFAFKVEGPLDLSLSGVMALLSKPLADAHIPVFTLSTYNTDYLLVKGEHLQKATQLLSSVSTVRAKA
jgi:hypothetical protein